MKTTLPKKAPWILGISIVLVACALHALPHYFRSFDLLRRFEWMTYDARAKLALKIPAPYATNLLAAIFIDDDAVKDMSDGKLGYQEKFPWPTHYYGQVARELAAQGVIGTGFDIMFELLDTNKFVGPSKAYGVPAGQRLRSDEFFAQQLKAAGNVVLAATPDSGHVPAALFRTNAYAIGSIVASADPDGVLRRSLPYVEYSEWHPIIQMQARAMGLELEKAYTATNHLFIPMKGAAEPYEVPLNKDGSLNVEEITGDKQTSPQQPRIPSRTWDLGIATAARVLKLDLDHPEIHPGNLILRGPNNLERRIPLDRDGTFLIDWGMNLWDNNDPRIFRESITKLIRADYWRHDQGQAEEIPALKGRIAFIGSVATGNNVADQGNTPIAKQTPLFSKHFNVANELIIGRFIQNSPLAIDLLIIALLGSAAALIAWRFRVLSATVWVATIGALYCFIAAWFFVQWRLWIPLFMPVVGGLALPHFTMITYRVIFEQREQRRVKGIFSRIVSPNIVNELLDLETLSLTGARRIVTVLFADVRGFTEMTDISHSRAEEYVRVNNLNPEQAEAHYNAQAAEALRTVNVYLATIADMVKKHEGTLDKYIGDCVMAFWGAPTPNEGHAAACVRAAIDAQRAMFALNQVRFAENKNREELNKSRIAQGLPPVEMLSLLALGTGINTGIVTVGLMGSESHILNYTVFGREVNLASRLEGVSGRGRIIISESTYLELQRLAPDLAATCVPQASVTVKGIKSAVNIYEVPWKQNLPPAPGDAASAPAPVTAAKPEPPPPTGTPS